MLQVQSASPSSLLGPFIRAYVQREAKLGALELVEPVVARLGVMLELEIAPRASYHGHMHMIRDFRQFAGEAPTSAFAGACAGSFYSLLRTLALQFFEDSAL